VGRLFGTDGVRGLANAELTPELAMAVAAASAVVLGSGAARPVAVVGRDPRASGEMLEHAVVAGLTSTGTDVLLAGVLPTPAVAYLVASGGADFGLVLSASHNPMPDNGVKLFGRGGDKLPDAVEDQIEARLDVGYDRPTGADIGRVRPLPDAAARYEQHLLGSLPHPLTGLHVVVDCAHGAAAAVAPEVYRRAGATVTAIGAEPDGLNINDGCGSTHLGPLAEAVVRLGADLGIAHDGDADRCLAVDAAGQVVDGDQILAVLAIARHEAGTLVGNTLVVTVMSNLGLHLAMREAGIEVRTTPVGDRYLLGAMADGGLTLGGEQSGHVLLLDQASTGDGILTALHLMSRVAATGRPLAELAGAVQRLPQVLLNVRVHDKAAVAASAAVADRVRAGELELGETGRVLLRPSGTEPLVRVMVEAPTQEQADRVAHDIATVVADA